MNEVRLQNVYYQGSKNIGLENIQTAKATGFNAAADDYMERGIDLNEQLIHNKPATYFFRMNSDSMSGAGIWCNDILIVDRSLQPVNGKVIVAVFNGELIVRRLHMLANEVRLLEESGISSSVVVNESDSYSVWGVVTYVIHTV